MLSVVAVDDESLALERLEVASKEVDGVFVAGTARGGKAGLELVRRLRPDVLLLDVHMPQSDGFDLLDHLEPHETPLVIFVSAHNHFAAKAFEVGAVDYMLKPFATERLRAALDRARESLRRAAAEQDVCNLARQVTRLRARDDEYAQMLWAQRRGDFARIPVELLDWVEAERDYVRLHARGQAYLMRSPLTKLADRLDPAVFVRVGRSALVRADRITAVRKASRNCYRVVLTTGQTVRAGRGYLKNLRGFGCGDLEGADVTTEPHTRRTPKPGARLR